MWVHECMSDNVPGQSHTITYYIVNALTIAGQPVVTIRCISVADWISRRVPLIDTFLIQPANGG